jgi:hypothetical protein
VKPKASKTSVSRRVPHVETCQRCGTQLEDGLCSDETCTFSDHFQPCPIGWFGHPDHPQDKECTCQLKEFIFTGDILHAGRIKVNALNTRKAFAEMESRNFTIHEEAQKDLGFIHNGEDPETI